MSEPIGHGILDAIVRERVADLCGEGYGGPRVLLYRGTPVSDAPDTIGSAIDALNAGIAMVNAASERMKAFGLSPQISVNGHDYGDKVSVYVQGELV